MVNKYMRKTIRMIKFFGFDPKLLFKNLIGLYWYSKDFFFLKKQMNKSSEFKINFFPILHEKSEPSGVSSGHYFHQDLLVAELIHRNRPDKHVDIGSRIDGFVAHVASYRTIEVFDLRNLVSYNENIIFRQADFTNLSKDFINYTDSISCLHAIEHFGLGRYGDSIDIDGHLKGLESIYRMLKQGGKFYFSAPIGPFRIEFNAHRVFSVQYLLELFNNKYKIISFSYVDDKGQLNKNVELTNYKINNNFGCHYGCGIFELYKI